MFTTPALMPFTVACVAGDVAPPAMKTLGVTIAFEGSPLASRTFTPPGGAGLPKVTGSATDRPSPTAVLAGRLIELMVKTVPTCTSNGAQDTPGNTGCFANVGTIPGSSVKYPGIQGDNSWLIRCRTILLPAN